MVGGSVGLQEPAIMVGILAVTMRACNHGMGPGWATGDPVMAGSRYGRGGTAIAIGQSWLGLQGPV